MFAFQIEREECGDDDDSYIDRFVEEGETSPPSTPASPDPGMDDLDGPDGRSRSLDAAKRFRSMLQQKLFRALNRCRGQGYDF